MPLEAAAPRLTPSANASPGAFGRRGLGEGAGDRVVAQRLEQFAGHEGLERRDAAALDLGPFRMRSGQHDEPRAQVNAQVGDAEDLRLLAPHHVGQPGLVLSRQAGREKNAPAIGLDRRQALGDVMRAGRASDVGRLAPAMATPDHARGDHGRGGVRVEPPPNEPLKRRRIGSRRHARDPVARRGLVQNLSPRRHEIGAKARRSPVDGDERGLHAAIEHGRAAWSTGVANSDVESRADAVRAAWRSR